MQSKQFATTHSVSNFTLTLTDALADHISDSHR